MRRPGARGFNSRHLHHLPALRAGNYSTRLGAWPDNHKIPNPKFQKQQETAIFPMKINHITGMILGAFCLLPLLMTGVFAAVPVDKPAGIPSAMSVDGWDFTVYDAAKKQNIVFNEFHASDDRGKVFDVVAVKKGNIKLTAECAAKGEYFLVTGYLENLQGGERGVVLSFTIPLLGNEAVFSNELNARVTISGSSTREIEGNVYPIAALCPRDAGSGPGVALAIPPSAPCEFGMTAGPKGMSVRIYLGISPETANFPNRAPFSFIIYPVDRAWGFRDALGKYYSFYPDYYTNRLDRQGLFIFLAEDGGEPIPARLDLFGYASIETQASWSEERLKIFHENGILTYPYMIVGMREVKFLKKKPANYAEAMEAYKNWTLKDNEGHPVCKEFESSGRDYNLRMQIDSSAICRANGDYALTIRHTNWGQESVTFAINPNPDLFKDTHNQSVGRDALTRIFQWLDKYPEFDGSTIDALGSNWPSNFNYRKDHFKYARYPLTCDPDGRACLHNEISHYEFLDTLRTELRARQQEKGGKTLSIKANGIYMFKAKPPPAPVQHYNAGPGKNRTELGRFFLSALLDNAHSEAGISMPIRGLEFMRVAMGRKCYAPTNKGFQDARKVEDWVNKCLIYTLYASNTRDYLDPILYYYPDGWKRDKALFDWFVPKCRMLTKAGWEPVTHARANGGKILMERYGGGSNGGGGGGVVYFAIMSTDGKERRCAVDIDLNSLGFGVGAGADGRDFSIEEIARNTPLDIGADGRVTLLLKPNKTCIIAVRKKDK